MYLTELGRSAVGILQEGNNRDEKTIPLTPHHSNSLNRFQCVVYHFDLGLGPGRLTLLLGQIFFMSLSLSYFILSRFDSDSRGLFPIVHDFRFRSFLSRSEGGTPEAPTE